MTRPPRLPALRGPARLRGGGAPSELPRGRRRAVRHPLGDQPPGQGARARAGRAAVLAQGPPGRADRGRRALLFPVLRDAFARIGETTAHLRQRSGAGELTAPGLRHRGLALAAAAAAPLRGRQPRAAAAPEHQPPQLGLRRRERRRRHDLPRAAARPGADLLAAVPRPPDRRRRARRWSRAASACASRPSWSTTACSSVYTAAGRLAAVARGRRRGRAREPSQPAVRQLPAGAGGRDRRPGRGAGARTSSPRPTCAPAAWCSRSRWRCRSRAPGTWSAARSGRSIAASRHLRQWLAAEVAADAGSGRPGAVLIAGAALAGGPGRRLDRPSSACCGGSRTG